MSRPSNTRRPRSGVSAPAGDHGQGGLARTRFAHQAQDFARLEGEVRGLQGGDVPVLLGDPGHFQQIDDAAPEAPHPVAAGFRQRNIAPAAFRRCLGAAWPEQAPVRRRVSIFMDDAGSGRVSMGRRGWPVGVDAAVERIAPDAPEIPHRVQAGIRPSQSQGIRMAGVTEQILGRQGFHDPAQIQDRQIVADFAGQIKVVA